MSRASAQRPLTLTEELEKLEQSITLTLQEIDHNFSQAHRIVTTSILPLVEQYAENSRDVWEGAKFWKQFFEASANVSLSGYEEKPDGTEVEADTDTVTGHETTEDSRDLNPNADETETGAGADDTEKDFEMSALEVSSTPRARPGPEATDAETSAYETLKKELEAEAPFDMDVDSGPGAKPAPDTDTDADTRMETTLPITPRKGYPSSPFIPPASREPPSAKQASAKGSSHPSDPIMHRMQDKTYRVQATPLTGRAKYTITPKPASTYTPNPTSSGNNNYGNDYGNGNDSSPEPEAPKLHEEIFSSPIKGLDTPATTRKRRYNGTPISRAPGRHTSGSSRASRTPSRPGQSRTPGSGPTPGPAPGQLRTPQPGTSILTPAKGKGKSTFDDGFDDDDDDDFDLDLDDTDSFSPPKTMQFHIPQSRLMKTPAKEASKKIVEDLLVSAGAGADVTDSVEGSPSLIRRADGLEDESF